MYAIQEFLVKILYRLILLIDPTTTIIGYHGPAHWEQVQEDGDGESYALVLNATGVRLGVLKFTDLVTETQRSFSAGRE